MVFRGNGCMVLVGHARRSHYGGTFNRLVLAEQQAIRLRNQLHTHNDADRELLR